MSGTPHGWTESTLGQLGKYLNGRAFKNAEWSDRGRPIIRIQNLTGSGSSFNYFEGEVEGRYVVRPGDLLMSWAATLGAFIWRGPEAVLNQHIFKVESSIDSKFHFYLLQYKLDEMARHTHGSGMVHITKGKFESVPALVPPLDEQRRIVDILDDHFSRLDAAERITISVAPRVSRLLTAAIDIEISDLRAEAHSLGDLLSEPLRNGHSARASTAESGIRTLMLTAVTKRTFSDEFTKVTSAEPDRVSDLWLRDGDILIERSNTPELVGCAALYRGPSNWAIFPDLLIRVRVSPSQVLPEFVDVVLRGSEARTYLRSRAKGLAGSMPKIDQAAVASLGIPVPSIATQASIVARLRGIEESLQVGLRSGAAAMSGARQLRGSLLHAAFTGQLTKEFRNG